MSGWITLDRSIKEHWLNKQDRVYSEFEAWIDILLTVNHSEQKLKLKGVLLTVKRGESVCSLETWGKRWKWNKNRVRRFFSLLQKDSMIEIKSEQITTRLTVCNYDSYQSKRNADVTQTKRKRNGDGTQTNPNKERNNDKEIIVSAFDAFWNFYGKKVDRASCFKKWCQVVTMENIDHVRHSLKIYIKQTENDIKFRKNPLTWLNGSCWLDFELGEQPKTQLPIDRQPKTFDY